MAVWKKIYRTLDGVRADLDTWLQVQRATDLIKDRWCFGKTPMQARCG